MKSAFRITVKKLQNGKWAAFSGGRFYVGTVSDSAIDSRILRLKQIGCEAQETIDNVDRELRKLGAFDESDPHGYLA